MLTVVVVTIFNRVVAVFNRSRQTHSMLLTQKKIYVNLLMLSFTLFQLESLLQSEDDIQG
ncbi:hypothetical protein CS536_10795 [Yersinia kristensenii]|nr:hypothetical protein ykris0001_25090 [Yersinia kristensenii ATCC 33638]PHZ35950.1 hypothetical protein CS536_10795 [Yersinia kristensenii]PJE83353.1 hypothetical protein CU276_12875 [Yersinia kristensenii]